LKVLILTCSTGQGHNTAAEAVCEALEARGAACIVFDPFRLKSERKARGVANAYVRNAVHAPAIFGAVYRLGSFLSTRRGRSPVYWANIRYAVQLERFLADGGFDAVVATHLYPAEALTFLKRRGRLNLPFYAVFTDYTCSPFWEETRPDVCFTPADEISRLCVRRGMPPEKLAAVGIPVKKEARERIGKSAARAKLGLESGMKLAVVMGGSMGGGKMTALVSELMKRIDSDTRVIVLCGHNGALKERLTMRLSHNARFRALGYTRQTALWMEAADVLLTKPGGLSITEAAAKGVPLVLTAPIPGCETHNAAYFQKRGMAKRAFLPADAAESAVELMENELACHVMRSRQKRGINTDAADEIARDICSAGEAGGYGGQIRC
jgi:processive 1,2-diacylglycerol beta-glucosyltransferase